ncbi:MAG TPA: arginase, partial [Rhodocyclaceae bacterium]|nr:arginase [Rhodocyclaceae bacterium]
MNRRIDIIPVPSALGAPDRGTAGGPEALRQAGLLTALHRGGHEACWLPALIPPTQVGRWEALADLCERLADTVAASIEAERLPLVIGGDHAIAAGTWRGVARAKDRPVGLLWIDAHLDAHVPEDSISGNPHGMPLALLLGVGDPRLASGVLSPRHVCVVGARAWEAEEMQRLRRYDVHVIDDAEIVRRGLPDVLREAMERVATGTTGFGITCDLDVFPLDEAPGVNTPAAGG